GLANFLNIPFNFKRAINIINTGITKTIDTATINDENLFISIAGVGFDALVAREFSKVKKRGFWSYFNIVAREYPKYKPREYIIEINGQVIKTEALFISFANSNQFGFNATIAPSASISDGLIDVCIFKKASIIEAPILAHFLFFRLIDETRYVEIIRATEFKIIQPQNNYIHIDGEPLKLSRELNVKINPLSLRVIVPK
ncbi:MAG TPA: diacylglycerol kinase family lipid kinase, partial [Bacteroidales bacterium]|nr:diacylglycerol kinase family lipid kinase [Bacteroidales bacterium]